ncbi:MAG: hypothetical protein HC811_02465 [Flammeovirgaceae bacterium]|nr:hypothetical protein [Flammeovirgaceae bacterium]
MWKFLTFLGVSLMAAGGLVAQVKKQFSVEKASDCKVVNLFLTTKFGNCFIRPSENEEILSIYSNQEFDDFSHSFKNETVSSACNIHLDLVQKNKSGVGRTISDRMLGADDRHSEEFWKVYLTETIPYNIDLSYGLGHANIDLSGLAINRFKVNTGSADVHINYSGNSNKIEMDTFLVKVEFGTVTVKQISRSKSKYVIADVGFGNMMLDFSGANLTSKHVQGSVGAGNLVIVLPESNVPVVVNIKNSWLCSVQPIKGMKKISDNSFVNQAYQENPKNALSFDLDVSMGNIVFKESK